MIDTAKKHGKLRFVLDLKRLSVAQNEHACLSWYHFLTFTANALDYGYSLVLFKEDIATLSASSIKLLESRYSIIWQEDSYRTPDLKTDFICLSSAQGLSQKVLMQFQRFYIRPTQAVTLINADWYWRLSNELDTSWAEAFRADSEETLCAKHKVTVISSIFNGDEFLAGFLVNAAQWSLYADCIHLLVRAGSSGNENQTLLEHIDQYPNAVYINLVNDPGLYEVWNQGVQLSSTPYLTNANIDDRRAPDQVERLVAYLEQHTDIALVSADLYITNIPNQAWDMDVIKECRLSFGSIAQERYTTGQMFRADNTALASHNLPHCMPVWRRDLHYHVGWFCEQRYGPSADWELWLRAGIQGAHYAYIAQPLGLYLKHENSYWRRQKTQSFDQRIVAEYAQLARNATIVKRQSIPFSRRINETRLAAERQDALGFFCALSDSFLSMRKPEPTLNERKIIDLVVKKTLGMSDFSHFLLAHYAAFFAVSDPIENALTVVVELLQSDQQPLANSSQLYDELEAFFVDHFVLTNAVVSLVGLAYIKRLREDSDAENQLLIAAYQQDSEQCWAGIARIYRFRVKLDVLTEKLTPIATCSTTKNKKLAIWFYPIAASNKYQRLLYLDCVAQGAQVTGIVNLQQFSQLRYDADQDAIIHIHWIGEFVTGDNSFPAKKGQQFLQQLQQLQADGFQLRWTVHNAISHDNRYQQEEITFRQALYELVDRVYIHHPMALTQLSWLPDQGRKCALLEHGHYLSLFSSTISQHDARKQLGLDQNDMVVFYFGLLRDYKGLDAYLTVFEKVSQHYPHCKLIIAGQVHSKRAQQMLDALHCPNIIVHDKFFTDEELEVYSRAASIGFLSYRSILTSGTLFHMLSAGLPVIAPTKGTLPAYIAQGWNGFSYETSADLEKILLHCCQLPPDLIATMGDNALQLATSLEWQFY